MAELCAFRSRGIGAAAGLAEAKSWQDQFVGKLLAPQNGKMRLNRANLLLHLQRHAEARRDQQVACRLGLKEDEYEVGERGWISERWLGSTTQADNRIGPPDEGLGYITLEGDKRMKT